MRRHADLFRDEAGFTTTSMVLSILITLSLLFTAAQVYRIQSASAEVQDVADATALSAENQVAEFMLIARFCDAVVLSLSLTGIAVTGLGIVALCTPVTAELSEGLITAGRKLIEARDVFSERAIQALDKLQLALPYFSAACAASVAAANNADSSGSSYLGFAMLVPSDGEPIKPDEGDKAQELADETEEAADDIRDDAARAEEASKEAEACKKRAYQHDCGDNPDYCMYERAAELARMHGADNPFYSSVDTWTFSVALERAQRYYRARLAAEAPDGSSTAEQARSALRKRFYRYAVTQMAEGYVLEDDESFEAYFPLLPKNTDEMRDTELYTENDYPVTVQVIEHRVPVVIGGEVVGETVEEERHYIMHAWTGCPNAADVASYGSISMMEAGSFDTCPLCEFTAASMGKVAAASTSIPNGFEYHYHAVAEEAEAYEKALEEAAEPKSEVKKGVNELLDDLVDALKETIDKRISPEPPGRFGSIAFTVNTATTSTTGGFSSGFAPGGALGPRAAVAGATLVDEGSDEGRTALNSALDNLRDGGGVAVGAAGMVLDAWSWLVVAYGDGQAALTDAVEQGLNGMPLIGASGLGTWAAGKLKDAIDAAGLQPAEVGALKPCLVNSGHVAAKGDGQASAFLAVKQKAVAYPLMSTDLFASVLTEAESRAVAQVEGLGDSIEIASIELLGEGGPVIPITVPLPDAAREYGISAIQGLFGRIRSFYVETTGVRIWE